MHQSQHRRLTTGRGVGVERAAGRASVRRPGLPLRAPLRGLRPGRLRARAPVRLHLPPLRAPTTHPGPGHSDHHHHQRLPAVATPARPAEGGAHRPGRALVRQRVVVALRDGAPDPAYEGVPALHVRLAARDQRHHPRLDPARRPLHARARSGDGRGRRAVRGVGRRGDPHEHAGLQVQRPPVQPDGATSRHHPLAELLAAQRADTAQREPALAQLLPRVQALADVATVRVVPHRDRVGRGLQPGARGRGADEHAGRAARLLPHLRARRRRRGGSRPVGLRPLRGPHPARRAVQIRTCASCWRACPCAS